MRALGVVVDVGKGVTSVKKGDHVIPLYTPECRQCPSCLSRKTNLCTAIRATQGPGPDARRHPHAFSLGGQADPSLYGHLDHSRILHRAGRKSRWQKSARTRPFDKVCYIGCGVTTGIGAVINTAKVEQGAKANRVSVSAASGSNVIQGLRACRRRHDHRRSISIRTVRAWGERFRHDRLHQSEGARHGSRAAPRQHDKNPAADQIGGADYTFRLHRQCHRECGRRFEACPPRLGASRSLSAWRRAGCGDFDPFRFQLVTGRVLEGHRLRRAARAGRSDVPKIVDWYMQGKIQIDPDDHACDAARENQRCVSELMKARRVDPRRGDVSSAKQGYRRET